MPPEAANDPSRWLESAVSMPERLPVGHDLTPSEAREVVDKTLGALQEARPITSRAVARGTRDYLEGVQEGVLDLPN